jgi:TrmH family RNA methyltransferase
LIEGLQPVGAAVEAGWEIEALLYAPGLVTSAYGQQLLAGYSGRLEAVSEDVIASIAEKDHPQGIIAIGKKRHTPLASIPATGYGAALVSPQDPGNVGTILRTLDAVGGSSLFLLEGGVDAYHPTALRAAMGATFAIPVIEAGFADFLDWCRANGAQLIGTSSSAKRDYRQEVPEPPWMLLLGNEQKGLTQEQMRVCDRLVSLPMRGRISSLNLAVAAGVLLFAYTRGI